MPTSDLARRLPRAPVRMIHLGLGAFHRAHQAWYTAVADPTWGIAAFTGRSADAARTLSAQDDVYTLVERSDAGDVTHQIEAIVKTHDGADLAALHDLITRPEVSVVTITVTEKGYRLGSDGRLDHDDPAVRADAAALGAALVTAVDAELHTMPARLLSALRARHLAGTGPVAVVPCDNLPANGATLRRALQDLIRLAGSTTSPHADRPSGSVASSASDAPSGSDAPDPTGSNTAHDSAWLDEVADFISTSVDRITPRTTASDIAALAEQGIRDPAPVVTEPFRSWVLAGGFRNERPAWERAGALFVDDIAPFERRKLWMLNGAHSLLAYTGIPRGHDTVAQAVADPHCRELMHSLWDLDERHLAHDPELRTRDYRCDLEARFGNSAIAHELRQIAGDGSAKLPVRVLEVLRRERADARGGDAALAALTAWVRFVLSELDAGRAVDDVAVDRIAAAAASDEPIRALLAIVAPDLADDGDVVRRVEDGYTWNDDPIGIRHARRSRVGEDRGPTWPR